MKVTKVNPALSVATQPDTKEFGDIAANGFAMVINNRPDGEDAIQPGSQAEETAARDAGLQYRHVPVTSSAITDKAIRDFQKAMAEADGPVLAHCKGGTRALTLWVLGEVLDGRMPAENVKSFGETLGFDLKNAMEWLSKRGTA